MPITSDTGVPNGPVRARLYFGWYIVAAGAVLLALGYASRYSFAVFFPVVTEVFGWPRDLGASILSWHLIFYGLTAPLAGFLVDRLGPRKTMLSGTVLLSGGMMLSSLSNAPWHFYLTFGVMAGVGLCLLASAPQTALLRNWFERKRGTAISVLFMGEALCYACFGGVDRLISALGWRDALLAIGLILAAVFIPLVAIFMTAHPRDRGLVKDGHAPETDAGENDLREAMRIQDQAWAQTDWTLPRAARTMRFYFLCLASFCIWGVSHHILVTHQIAFALDLGFGRTFASDVISLGGITFGIGCLISLFSEKWGREWTLTLGSVLSISGVLAALAMEDAGSIWLLYYYAVMFGLGFGISVPIVASATTDLFQGPRAGAAIGAVWFSFALGGAMGPWLGGWLFELGGELPHRLLGRSRGDRCGLRGDVAGRAAQGPAGAGQGEDVIAE